MKKALIIFGLTSASLFALALFGSARQSVQANVDAPVKTFAALAPAAVANQAGFEIEVLVDGRTLPEYYARGRNYVEAFDREEYELRVRNPLGVRVAVALSVDGLNTIDARRTSATNASKWVIEPYGTMLISGWQMSSERARHFYFTTERNSYGTKLGQTSNLGIISAVFFRERRPIAVVQPPPRRGRPMDDEESMSENKSAPEPSANQARDRSSGSSTGTLGKDKRAEAYPAPDDDYAATGIGRNVRHDVRWVNLDLEDRATAEVSIRYEYRAELVRMGIRPRPYPYPDSDTPRRRERATGFEDRRYSPEP